MISEGRKPLPEGLATLKEKGYFFFALGFSYFFNLYIFPGRCFVFLYKVSDGLF